PATLGMAVATILTTWHSRRAMRHVWQFVGVVGCAGCLWWMSSLDDFTSKEHVALVMGIWGLFVGLFPPAFLQNEIESLDRRASLYGGAVAVVFLSVPMATRPTMTSTVFPAGADRSAAARRRNLRETRPEIGQTSARVADYYHQRGVAGAELGQLTAT